MLMWIFGIVGTLGIAGTIAACVLAPAVAIPIVQAVVSAVMKCKPCLIALAILAALFTGALYGAHVEKAKCRANELAAQIRNQKIDLENANKAAADEANRANTIEVSADDQRKKDAAYIATLEARPSCALDDNDLGGVSDDKSRPGRKKPSAGAR